MPKFAVEYTEVYEHTWIRNIEAPDQETAEEFARKMKFQGPADMIYPSSLEVDEESKIVVCPSQ